MRPNADKITLSYLKFQTPEENRGNIIFFFLFFLDFLGIFPLLGEPFLYTYFIAAIIPVAVIHLWAIFYIIAPYKFEHSYYLLMGVFGVVNTYVYFLTTQKIIYLHVGLTGIAPRIFGIIFFLGLLIFVNWLNLKALYSGTYYKLQRKGSGNLVWLSIGALGFPIGQILLMFVYNERVVMMVLVIALTLLSIIIAYFSIFIHRYYFIRKNMEVVKKIDPRFGLSKKERGKRHENFKLVNVHNPSRKNKKRRKRK